MMPAFPGRQAAWRPTTLLSVVALMGVLGARSTQAGIFDDDEARRQIRDMSIKTNERSDTVSKGQIELANQIQTLREENARLRGQVETLTYELESAKKRQQDFYVDLDGRLRKLEPQVSSATESRSSDESRSAADAPKKPVVDPATETRDYETALNLFRANKFKESAAAFDAFVKARPDSTLAPNAEYWEGHAYSSLRDCRRASELFRHVAAKWPSHPKAPDALVNAAACQQELGDAKTARSLLEVVVAKYPDSPAAATARQRLKK